MKPLLLTAIAVLGLIATPALAGDYAHITIGSYAPRPVYYHAPHDIYHPPVHYVRHAPSCPQRYGYNHHHGRGHGWGMANNVAWNAPRGYYGGWHH